MDSVWILFEQGVGRVGGVSLPFVNGGGDEASGKKMKEKDGYETA